MEKIKNCSLPRRGLLMLNVFKRRERSRRISLVEESKHKMTTEKGDHEVSEFIVYKVSCIIEYN